MSASNANPAQAIIPGVSAATVAALANEGFPPKFIQAFLSTANALNMAVMTRTPGGAGLGLISRRFDLKGFYIKAKSCDWGPMAGFVCMLPWFNKNGAEAVVDNLHYSVDYLVKRPFLSGVRGSAYLPIRIPQSRLAEIAALPTANLATDMTALTAQAPAGPLLGYATSTDKSVVMDFMLQCDPPPPAPMTPPPEPLWSLWCGNVWVASADKQSFTLFDPQSSWFSNANLVAQTDDDGDALVTNFAAGQLNLYLGMYKEMAVALTDTQKTALAAQRTALAAARIAAFAGAPAGDSTRFTPVAGFVNPFPPYATAHPATATAPARADTYDDYRDVVSGDFDLFAVWPTIGGKPPATGSIGGLVRWNEQPPPANAAQQAPAVQPAANAVQPNLSVTGALFARVPSKYLALSLVASPNVIVEFVPNDPTESPQYGNANSDVLLTAQMLNSLVYYYYNVVPGQFQQPSSNVAFHSDEGGRPFTKALGDTVALFLPDHLATSQSPAQIIGKPADLLTAIVNLKDRCLVPIQAAWLGVMMNAAAAPDLDNMTPKLKLLLLGALPNGVNYTNEQNAAYEAVLTLLNDILAYDTRKKKFTKALGKSTVVYSRVIPAILEIAVGPDAAALIAEAEALLGAASGNGV
jgi:hypothetical protein